ncbi:hypothetical protein [Natrinema versiforme]|uniref:Small CPxCG-related zinc finger protein n=1 Tax=Natrinema versiforme JCM 10478 TaxID=1227496 RepID=L9Y4E5_9EURY|nr:hypothetical protein [Natrinema versiforme]ELY67763.1 hypothetical protein C489_09391 [Natrinema versiforme JCM 10478]
MGIKTNVTSFSHRLREQVQSTLRDDSETADDEPVHGDEEAERIPNSSGNLFHCSHCGDVYIATEKRVCSNCDAEVDQVRSTLACNGR